MHSKEQKNRSSGTKKNVEFPYNVIKYRKYNILLVIRNYKKVRIK